MAGFSGVTDHKVRLRYDRVASVWIAEEWRRDKYVPARRLELPESASLSDVEVAYRRARRGRSTAENRAAGLVDLRVWMSAELLARVDAAAARAGVSRAELVTGWAKRLAKSSLSGNRHGTPK